ncbi:hypothetical protein BGW80DRAFT_1257518 [Lactifluus volemus]|nr:hypothetical protein BGW80DRAFT_1257518 [Lactifluus volemus]
MAYSRIQQPNEPLKLLQVLVPFRALSTITYKRILGSIQPAAGNNQFGDPLVNMLGENVAMQGYPQDPHYIDVVHDDSDMPVQVGYHNQVILRSHMLYRDAGVAQDIPVQPQAIQFQVAPFQGLPELLLDPWLYDAPVRDCPPADNFRRLARHYLDTLIRRSIWFAWNQVTLVDSRCSKFLPYLNGVCVVVMVSTLALWGVAARDPGQTQVSTQQASLMARIQIPKTMTALYDTRKEKRIHKTHTTGLIWVITIWRVLGGQAQHKGHLLVVRRYEVVVIYNINMPVLLRSEEGEGDIAIGPGIWTLDCNNVTPSKKDGGGIPDPVRRLLGQPVGRSNPSARAFYLKLVHALLPVRSKGNLQHLQMEYSQIQQANEPLEHDIAPNPRPIPRTVTLHDRVQENLRGYPQDPHYIDVVHDDSDMPVQVGYYHRPQPGYPEVPYVYHDAGVAQGIPVQPQAIQVQVGPHLLQEIQGHNHFQFDYGPQLLVPGPARAELPDPWLIMPRP